MTTDRLLTEIERQQKYLDMLPDDFQYPLFNSKQALESQRRNGYRNTAAAAREIVDNALEAGAKKVHIVFDRPQQRKAHQRQDAISAIAFIDNGSGMLKKMARFALSWGGGTHYDDPDFIGKFGFGLPNASINQTRRVEVYTKTKDAKAITKAWLDVTDVKQHGLHTIPEPIEGELPEFVSRYLRDNKLSFDHGTVVVWVTPDRLTYRTGASLKEHLIDDFGVTYRYLLGDVDLRVEGVEVNSVDPLFLDPAGRYFEPEAKGGAILREDRLLPVKYFRDKDTGALHLAKVDDQKELDAKDVDLLAVGGIQIRIARFPVGFAEQKRGRSDTDAHRRFEIRKSRRGISFVRSRREIETVDAFPRSLRDISSGLGHWPLLQGYAYHWAVEIRFEPSLDEVFGITNDKQSVRPIEDFWRLLAKEEIDRLLLAENNWQMKQRQGRKPQARTSEEPTAAERAAAAADTVSGKKTTVPERDRPKAKAEFEAEAQKRAGVTGASLEEAKKAVEAEAKRRPYRIDYFDDPNAAFFEPSWELGTSVVVRVNRQHPFYITLYGELLELAGGTRAKEAVDVLLIALAKAELSLDDETAKLMFEHQRKSVWSPFLSNALKVLAQTLQPSEEREEGEGQEEAAASQAIAA